MVRILVRSFVGPDSQFGYQPLEIDSPADCRELIHALTRSTLADWTCRPELDGSVEDEEGAMETDFSGPLSQTEIETRARVGEIKFGRKRLFGLPEEGEAIEAAEDAFSGTGAV